MYIRYKFFHTWA